MEDKSDPKTEAASSGGNGPGGKTRVGAGDPGGFGKPKRIHIDNSLTVKELAGKMGMPVTAVVKKLFEGGEARTENMIVELDLAVRTAKALGYELI